MLTLVSGQTESVSTRCSTIMSRLRSDSSPSVVSVPKNFCSSSVTGRSRYIERHHASGERFRKIFGPSCSYIFSTSATRARLAIAAAMIAPVDVPAT